MLADLKHSLVVITLEYNVPTVYQHLIAGICGMCYQQVAHVTWIT